MEGYTDARGYTTLFVSGHTPTSPLLDDEDAASRHAGGTNLAFGDGSVRLVKNAIDMNIYRSLSTRAGGEVVNSDAY
jgi:prepilin-type processing-associated H-X9-DG protein